MKQYHWWLVFFFSLFSFSIGMIVWTIMSAATIDINEDQSFSSTYHDVDDKYNTMMHSTKKFNDKYETILSVNGKSKDLNSVDVFLSQRALEKKSINKNMLNVGENSIEITVIDKQTFKSVENLKINILLTRSTVNHDDIRLQEFSYKDGIYRAKTKIDIEGNWNMTGYIQVNEDKGYFYYKTKSSIK
ncbi:MAG: FixH family protein [Campylobacterota bacterium]|nr:FixH family protein [Campylobacterota bacterium]